MKTFTVNGKMYTHTLQRGIEGFGPIDPLLRIAEFLVDLYVRFRRRK